MVRGMGFEPMNPYGTGVLQRKPPQSCASKSEKNLSLTLAKLGYPRVGIEIVFYVHKSLVSGGKQASSQIESPRWDLDPRPTAYEAVALPLKLLGHLVSKIWNGSH